MFEDHNDIIYEILKSVELIDRADLEELMASHLKTGKSLANSIIDSELVERNVLLSTIADYLGCKYEENLPKSIPTKIASTITPETARTYAIVPFEVDKTSISILQCLPPIR